MWWPAFLQIKSNDPEARLLAVQRLADADSARAFDSLAEAIRDEDMRVARAAVTAIGKISGEKPTNVLINALADHHPELRQAAVDALRNKPTEHVIAALVGVLNDFDAGVRGRAARVLESMRWRPSNPKEEIWFAVAQGHLAHVAAFGAQAIEALEMVLLGGPYSLQVSALHALGQIADERVLNTLVPALKSSDHAVSIAAVEALSHFGGTKASDALVPMLRHPDHRVRVAAIDAVAGLEGQQGTDALTELLKDSIWDVRRAAAHALGKCKDPKAVEGLVIALKDADNDVRESAIASLGNIGGKRAIGPLVLALVDPDSSVRRTAGVTIQKLNPSWPTSAEAQQVIPELRAALDFGDSAVRYAATSVLGRMGKLSEKLPGGGSDGTTVLTAAGQKRRKVFSVFVELLKDQDRDVRLASVQSLGRLGDPRAASALMTAMSDADESVRHAAAEAVEFLNFLGAA
jgi:HEAT repeat protein